jgi:anaerobic selenocysteine-containing dehydrogenase
LYYGGTGYENKQGLGVTLAPAEAVTPLNIPYAALRPKEDELLGVPVTKLYDDGTTLAPAKLLAAHVERYRGVVLHPATAEKLALGNGEQAEVRLGGARYLAKALVDASISTGVVLIPRSMGIALTEPAVVQVSAAEKAQEA